MLLTEQNIYCGIYDSSIVRKNYTQSADRTVQCYEIELFHKQQGNSYINGKKYPTKKGMLLCAKPGQIRHSDFPVRCSFIRYFPSKENNVEIDNILNAFPDCFYIENESEIDYLLGVFSKIGAAIMNNSGTEKDKLRINALFFDVIYRVMCLLENKQDNSGSDQINRIARDAYEFINENYTKKCSLRVIADAVNISPNHLHTVFTRCIGLTPYEYVLSKRVDKAKKLILTGEKNMLEIALETGFCSQAHFNKAFKEKTGETPATYRKNMLKHY